MSVISVGSLPRLSLWAQLRFSALKTGTLAELTVRVCTVTDLQLWMKTFWMAIAPFLCPSSKNQPTRLTKSHRQWLKSGLVWEQLQSHTSAISASKLSSIIVSRHLKRLIVIATHPSNWASLVSKETVAWIVLAWSLASISLKVSPRRELDLLCIRIAKPNQICNQAAKSSMLKMKWAKMDLNCWLSITSSKSPSRVFQI